MNSYTAIPCEIIADHVHKILVIENYHLINSFALPLFANGSPTLLFLSTKATIDEKATNHLTLFGQTVFPETLKVTDKFTMIAYFFKPFSLNSLFSISALEITDKPVDLTLLSLPDTTELQEKLLNATTTTKMISILDNYIAKLIKRTTKDTKVIQYATDKLAVNTSKESLVKVQKELHITERTFQRLFEKSVGVAPNLYRRICQFNAAFEQLNNRNFNKLSDIAFQHGYADQSHYIRAFKEFTNITPKDYMKFASQD